MERRDVLGIAFALFTVGLFVAPPATAGDDDQSVGENIEGTYKSSRSKSSARERINEQIEEVVEQLPFYKRPFARDQLRENTEPCTELTFKYSKNQISIQCDDDPPAKSKPDGTTTTYKAADGETHQLSQRINNGRVIQFWDDDKGSRTNIYRRNGKTLIMSVKIKSSQLPEPVTYTRAFLRQ